MITRRALFALAAAPFLARFAPAREKKFAGIGALQFTGRGDKRIRAVVRSISYDHRMVECDARGDAHGEPVQWFPSATPTNIYAPNTDTYLWTHGTERFHLWSSPDVILCEPGDIILIGPRA
jgi:hypothetical protein